MKILNSIRKDGLDVYHLKIEDKKQLKNDHIELTEFEKKTNVPISVYEDKIKIISIKKMLHRILIYASMEVKQILEQHGIFGKYNISFGGAYNEEMKNEIEEYVIKNGLSKMKRKTRIKADDKIIGTIEFYDTIITKGFYYSRQGLLRGNITKKKNQNILLNGKISGNLSDVEDIKKYLDLDYPEYLYGEKGPQQLLDYYQKNFIDSFEFGRSFLMDY